MIFVFLARKTTPNVHISQNRRQISSVRLLFALPWYVRCISRSFLSYMCVRVYIYIRTHLRGFAVSRYYSHTNRNTIAICALIIIIIIIHDNTLRNKQTKKGRYRSNNTINEKKKKQQEKNPPKLKYKCLRVARARSHER